MNDMTSSAPGLLARWMMDMKMLIEKRSLRALCRLLLTGWLLALVLAAIASPVFAQGQGSQPPEPGMTSDDPTEDPDGIKVQRGRNEVSQYEVDRRTREYISSSSNKITIHQIVQEMIDDFVADIADINIAAVSPVALRGVGMTPNLSGAFGMWVESELINAVSKHSDIRVKRCVSCQALRTRLEGNDWVVSLGHVTQEELAATAKRIGVNAYIDAFVAYMPGANVVSMNVQIFRASDGKILWSETYQSDATTAAVLRSGDRILTRDEARAELVRKIEQRPYYGYQFHGGAGFIPYDSPTTSTLGGGMIGGRLYEKFGEDRRWLFGLHGEGFINLSEQNRLLGAFLGATAQYQINTPNLNDPTYRVGGIVEGFIAGNEGNSFAIEAVAEAVFQFRLGASVSAMYFVPTQFAGYDLGGFGLKARFLFNW